MRSLLLGYALAFGAAPVSGPVAGQVPEWTLERGVTIGSVDDPVYGLSGVGGVLADAERVFVLLRQDATVRVFSRAGAFIRDLGRRGQGPGQGWDGRTDPAEFEVTRLDLHGDTVYRRRIEYEPRPVPSDYFDDRIADQMDGPNVSNRRAYARALREFYEQRRYFPPVTAVTVGSDGTTWLAREREDGDREWLVLDGTGSAIGRFRLPRSGGVRFANLTECWVVERDALDIPYVVRYNIVR